MRKLQHINLKIFCGSASGPFSFVNFRGFKRTAVSWRWIEGDMIVLEFPAAHYIKRYFYNQKIMEILEISTKLSQLLPRLEFCELETLEVRYNDLLESISLRYDPPSESETYETTNVEDMEG